MHCMLWSTLISELNKVKIFIYLNAVYIMIFFIHDCHLRKIAPQKLNQCLKELPEYPVIVKLGDFVSVCSWCSGTEGSVCTQDILIQRPSHVLRSWVGAENFRGT